MRSNRVMNLQRDIRVSEIGLKDVLVINDGGGVVVEWCGGEGDGMNDDVRFGGFIFYFIN